MPRRRVTTGRRGYPNHPSTEEIIVTDSPDAQSRETQSRENQSRETQSGETRRSDLPGSDTSGSDTSGSDTPGSDTPGGDLWGTGAPPSVQPYTDPVEEEGARFARAADEDDGLQRPATGGDPVGGDLSPDFLAPAQPAPPT